MNKSSTSYLFECYIWLVNTIARGPITRAAIDDKWARASVNDYKTDSIPECTSHRWRNNVELLFDVTIKCNTRGEYYIEDGNNLHSDDWQKDDIEYAIASYVDEMSDELLRTISDAKAVDMEQKQWYRDNQWPKDLQAAYDLGKRLVEKAKE